MLQESGFPYSVAYIYTAELTLNGVVDLQAALIAVFTSQLLNAFT